MYLFTGAVRELLTHVPAGAKSEQPTNPIHALAPDLAPESDLTALHLAAYSGSENVVRALLNSSGVNVEGACSPSVSGKPFAKRVFIQCAQYSATYNANRYHGTDGRKLLNTKCGKSFLTCAKVPRRSWPIHAFTIPIAEVKQCSSE